MSAEFFARFTDSAWYSNHLAELRAYVCALPTFKCDKGGEIWLQATEEYPNLSRWEYDVRLWLRPAYIELDIGGHPPSIERDLTSIFSWVRAQTHMTIYDDDDAPVSW